MADAFDVDPTGRDVGGHKHLDFSFAEGIHRPVPLRLALVAVDGFSSEAIFLQVFHHLVGAIFRACEDQGRFNFRPLQHVHEQISFGSLADKEHALVHGLRRTAHACDFHPDGVGKDGFGQLHNACRHGGAEEQTLSFLREHGNDLANVMDEAHVQHGVCFVQDQKLHLCQGKQALVAKVEQAPWSGDEHIDPFAQLVDLFVLADPAKNEGSAHIHMLRVRLDVLVDLGGQLTGGRQDEHPRHLLTRHRIVGEVVHQGQGERGGLAGSCLGNAHHITPLEDVRNGLLLNGGGRLVSERHKGIEHTGVQAHF